MRAEGQSFSNRQKDSRQSQLRIDAGLVRFQASVMKFSKTAIVAAMLIFALSQLNNAAAETNVAAPVIEPETMQRIHDEVKTPFKYGVVQRGDSTNQLVDCPNIFRADN
jgi:hypothetical protein